MNKLRVKTQIKILFAFFVYKRERKRERRRLSDFSQGKVREKPALFGLWGKGNEGIIDK